MSFKYGMRPVHPGEVLREDFLRPAGMTQTLLPRLCVCPRHVLTTLFVSGVASLQTPPCG
jgi:plasmid maintenance system antidote protein VapI